MPIFSSSNGRFSFAPLVGNGTIRREDVDIVAGTGVVTGGGVAVVGTMVADKDGVVVVVRMMGDVAGAEVTAGSVVPGESAGVATTDSDVVATDSNVVATDSNVVAATDSDVVATDSNVVATDSNVVAVTDSNVVATDSNVVAATDSDVVVTTDSDIVVTTDLDVVVPKDSGVVVEVIGGRVRGGSVMHSMLKSQVPDGGECQFPRNEITQQCLPSSVGCNILSKLGSTGITQFAHPWIAASLPVVQRQAMAVHELYSAAAAAQASVH
jgi:hypothetical protein